MSKNWSREERNAFKKFTSNLNPASPHPCDEERWRDFVIISHKKKSHLSRGDVETSLSKNKKTSQNAGVWADRYEVDRRLLEQYDKSNGEDK